MKKETPRQLAKILYELAKDAKSAKELQSAIGVYLSHLKEVQALKKISFIIEEFKNYVDKLEGKESVTIVSARKLTPKSVELILSSLRADKVKESVVDENLLGGVIIKTNNYLLDASLKTQLNKLENKLAAQK